MSISGNAGSNAAAIERGKVLFAAQCADCHGADGKGKQERGSPNLTDGIWLYGGGKRNIVESIRTGRGGKMPSWGARLDPLSIKLLTLYVHSLGGGK
jgi:cytochrome c oxidase cbb3-type subunit 3